MPEIFSVAELTNYLADLLRADQTLSDVQVRGEISNATLARSGHFYFTLKDEDASLGCVMWRNAVGALFDVPQVGEQVIVHGRVDLYAQRGQLQLVVDALAPAGGIGDLYRLFEATKARLQEEGLFDAERKRPLPRLPRRIGLVTSSTGAALRDVLRVLAERWPLADVLLVPSLVQGEQAPPNLQAALYSLYARDDIDVIILARGGGSIEDLWAFNDEGLARLLAQSPVPTITGVGHETDFTIVDFVADYRAPTPSAAAAAATPDIESWRQFLTDQADSMSQRMAATIRERRFEIERQQARLRRLSPQYRIDQQRLMLDEQDRRLNLAISSALRTQRHSLAALHDRLDALSPTAVLSRGYAIVQNEAGQVIYSVAQIAPGQDLTVRVSEGAFPVRTQPSNHSD
ncbi:MAG: exodeoxyribonuclease VII large subunit [Caldilineales bacterium]|nr:exodeoxyribonuclease VII large subunit [Caldilineales bacterium]